MKFKQFAALVVALALAAAGCATKTQPMLNGAPISAVPEGCVSTNSITAAASGLTKQTFTPVNAWLHIWKITPDQGQLVFSTYDVPKGKTYVTHEYADNDALVVVNFQTSEKLPVGVGNYSKAPDAKMRVKEANVSSKTTAGGVFDKNGTLAISHMDEKYVCGKLQFNDGKNMLEGDFIAEVARF